MAVSAWTNLMSMPMAGCLQKNITDSRIGSLHYLIGHDSKGMPDTVTPKSSAIPPFQACQAARLNCCDCQEGHEVIKP